MEKAYVSLSVMWTLLPAELDAFKVFFHDTLGQGTASFRIELRYPRNSDLDDWIVRFDGTGYEMDYLDGAWSVRSGLVLLSSAYVDDPAPEVI